MTTAISISDTIYETAEQFAVAHGLSRNELYEAALKQYLKERQPTIEPGLRERFDAVYNQEESRLDPLFGEIQVRSLPEDEWES